MQGMVVEDRKSWQKFCYGTVQSKVARGMVHELDMSFCQNSSEQAWLCVLVGVWLHNEAHHDRKNGQECCIMMLVQSMVVESKDKHGAMVLFL